MIKIGKPAVVFRDEKAFLEAEIAISAETALKFKNMTRTLKNCPWRTGRDYPPRAWVNRGSKLYFAVDKSYTKYLCTERSDAFVIALLWYAILTEEDICFEMPMSQKLYQGLTERLIPALCSDKYRQIRLTGSVTSEKLVCQGAVGSGMSCGVDSFYTMRTHQLTHVTYYEYGHIYMFDQNISLEEYYQKVHEMADRMADSASKVAEQSGLGFVYVKTNIDEDFYRGGVIYRAMYGNLACSLAIQKLFCTYISSSSGHGNDLETGLIVPTQNYENLICSSCKTETFEFVSSDFKKRFEKQERLADDPLFAQYAEVCFAPQYLDEQFTVREKNCGECYGCLKTMIVFDLLGKLDRFDRVFDLRKYYADRRKYIKIVADGSRRPELSSLKQSWVDIVHYSKTHSGSLCNVITELDRELDE